MIQDIAEFPVFAQLKKCIIWVVKSESGAASSSGNSMLSSKGAGDTAPRKGGKLYIQTTFLSQR